MPNEGADEGSSNPPKFIREFSREKSPEERSALAKEIVAKLHKARELVSEAGTLKPGKVREEAKGMIDYFYEGEKLKWADTPYSKEDIKKYFTPENLSSLSMEDYILLLRRFPSEMVTNAVRQGVIDHTGSGGAGNKEENLGTYSTGLQEILVDGKLRSPFGVFLKDGLRREAVAQCLKAKFNSEDFMSREAAIERLDDITVDSGNESGSYSDKIAMHFAAEEVAGAYYGGERNNQPFFVFPSAYIAANYFFSGDLGGEEAGTGGNHNDIWVWEEKGNGSTSLDTGVLFLPAEAEVDRKTGSLYQLDGENHPIVNQDDFNLVRHFVQSEKFEGFVKRAKEIYAAYYKHGKQPQDLNELRDILANEHGISDPKIQEVLMFTNYDLDIHSAKNGERDLDESIKKLLIKAGRLFVLAKGTISSQEYWEKYFTDHPEQKVKRIVYYHGSDPTAALRTWREENGLGKRSGERDLGFPEKSPQEENLTPGMEQFRSIALEVIDDLCPDT